MAQLEQLAGTAVAAKFFDSAIPESVQDFRDSVPLTTYEDYRSLLSERDPRLLPASRTYWTSTTGAGGRLKLIPFTGKALSLVEDAVLAAFIIATTTAKGEVNISSEDRILYSLAPKPYLSGFLAEGMKRRFNFNGIPSVEESNTLPFEMLLEVAFERALGNRVDVLVALSSVLVRMGDKFSDKTGDTPFSKVINPRNARKLLKAYLSSKRDQRPILPKDLWPVKGIVAWGADTSLYSAKIRDYWGRDPIELFASTECGVLAMQSWTHKGLTFLPYGVFLEFIPETESIRLSQDPSYVPNTILLDQLEVGQRYELVITSFHGMPFLRYRLGHFVRVLSLGDPAAGIVLPQILDVGRSDSIIDIGGFTRLDEHTITSAIISSGIPIHDWVVVKDSNGGSAYLHFYLELKNELPVNEICQRLDHTLQDADPGYRDLHKMLGMEPLKITIVTCGTFERFRSRKNDRSSSAIDRERFVKINPSAEALGWLREVTSNNQ